MVLQRRPIDPAPMNALGLRAELDAVEYLSDDFRGLGHGHSGAVKEQVAVRERYVPFANCLKFSPPWISLQYGLFP